jgi:hypothetical protein
MINVDFFEGKSTTMNLLNIKTFILDAFASGYQSFNLAVYPPPRTTN